MLRAAWLALACVALGFPARADAAESRLELQVSRQPGAESCPDPEALRARVESLRGERTSQAAARYEVDFARGPEGFEATLRTGEPASVRVLRAPGDSCAGLAEAAAVTLALLLDAEPVRVPPPPPPPEPTRVVTEKPRGVRLTGALGGSVMFGLMRRTLPALLADVGVQLRTVRLSLGALWSWSHALRFGPGKLRESLLAGSARVCLPMYRLRWLQLDACSGLFVGAFSVRASGYTRDDERHRLWLSAPLELALSLGTRTVSAELAAGALFTARAPDFGVAGLGTAYASWPVSPVLSLRVRAP